MSNHTLHIKNMVCPRCIETVEHLFSESGIETQSVSLGTVSLSNPITTKQQNEMGEKLFSKGFELLSDPKSKLVSDIKSHIIQQIHHSEDLLNTNFSDFLSDKLNLEYSSLSRTFSTEEGITIERFILKQKIERVKQLLFYNELTLSEIAHQMGYSSVAHLSSQFKKETGITPTSYRKNSTPDHQSLDSI